MKNVKQILLFITIPFIYFSCQIRFVELKFINKTDNAINVYIGSDSANIPVSYTLNIESKANQGMGFTKQSNRDAKESVAAFVDNILIKNSQQDTLLYLMNKSEVLEYLKNKKRIDRGTFIIEVKQPK